MAFQEIKAYVPGRVWEVLAGSEDVEVEELMDVQVGLTYLPPAESTFIIRLSQGYTGKQAMSEAHLKGNQTRLKTDILMKLTEIINGKGEDDKAGPHKAAGA